MPGTGSLMPRVGTACWLAAAVVSLSLATGCATPEHGVGELAMAEHTGVEPGDPSPRATAAWRGDVRVGRYSASDYEHHLDTLAPEGLITIDSTPRDAQVFLLEPNGMEVYQGRTPMLFSNRANGMSLIFIIRKPGYVDRRVDVATSYRDPNVRLSVHLDRDMRYVDPSAISASPYENLRDSWNLQRRQAYYATNTPEARGSFNRSIYPELEYAPNERR